MGEGLWAPRHRALTTGLVLTITFVASEALAVVTVSTDQAHGPCRRRSFSSRRRARVAA